MFLRACRVAGNQREEKLERDIQAKEDSTRRAMRPLSGGTKTGWISFMLSQAFVLCAWLWACVQRWGAHRGGLEDIVEGRQVEVEHHDILVDLVLGGGGRGGTPLDLAPRSMHPLGVLRQRGEGRR